MKRTLIIITVVLTFFSFGAIGQINVRNLEIKQNGGRSEVLFDAQISNKATARSKKLTMIPVLYNDNRSVELPPIVVESRRTRIMDARNGVEPLDGAYLTENGRTVRYSAVVNNGEWLSNSDLRFDLIQTGCCDEVVLAPLYLSKAPVTAVTLPAPAPTLTPNMTLNIGGMIITLIKNASVLPLKSTVISSRTVLDRLEVRFAVNSSRLNLFAFNNGRTLNDIIAALRTSEGALPGRIEITGYASPEGQEAANYALAQNRALAVRNYILDNVRYLRPANFDIINGGENWEGLYKLVEESSMPGRWQVLDIIESTPPNIDYYNNTSRKKILMDLNGGRTWKYMLANFFPRLRSAATVTVYAPQAYMQQTVTTMMPPVQNTEIINRAIDLIGERNSAQALSMLTQVENDPRAWNPMAICYLLEYNTTRAKEYFQMAADAGYSEAKSNLAQMAQTNNTR